MKYLWDTGSLDIEVNPKRREVLTKVWVSNQCSGGVDTLVTREEEEIGGQRAAVHGV